MTKKAVEFKKIQSHFAKFEEFANSETIMEQPAC
jgi:hypothetical protein